MRMRVLREKEKDTLAAGAEQCGERKMEIGKWKFENGNWCNRAERNQF